MKNVAPPSTVKVQEERFSFSPPPMVEADRGKTFDSTMSVSDIPLEADTCSSLLSKMADVVSENHDYAPAAVANANLFVPQAPVQPIQAPALSFAEELAQVYAAHMPRVFAEQEAQRQTSPNYTAPIQSFVTTEPEQEEEEEEEVITVVDFTKTAAPVVQAQPKQPRQTNSGLNAILKSKALAPANQNVSSSWFA